MTLILAQLFREIIFTGEEIEGKVKAPVQRPHSVSGGGFELGPPLPPGDS